MSAFPPEPKSHPDLGKSPTTEETRDDSSDDEVNEEPTGQLHGWRLYCVQFCLCFSLVLSVMDSSVVATALVTIGSYFDDYITLQWLALAYLLTYLGFALIFSRISDIIGRKWATVVANVILGAASLGAGLSQTLNQVIAFRAIQGIGGAGLYAMAMTTLPEITPPAKFGPMTAIIGIVFAVSAVLGPTIGGVITTHSTWRWIFNFNVPCNAFIVILIIVCWPVTASPGAISLRQLDLLGCLLFVAASVLLVFALQEGGAGTYDWNSATIICCLVFAGLAAIAFSMWITYLSSRQTSNPKSKTTIAPLFHIRIITHKIMLATIIITILTGYIFYTILITLPQRFQIVNNRTPQTAGLDLLPVSGASALGSFLGGFLSSKANRSFYTLTLGCAFTLLGSGLMYSVGADLTVPDKLYGFEVLIGLGFGLVMSSSTVLIKLYAERDDSAVAQGLMAQSRILGGNIGLAVATIITNGHLSGGLRGKLSEAQIADLRKSLNVIQGLTLAEKVAVARVFAEGFVGQMMVCAVLAGVALGVCGFVWERRPPQFEDLVKKGRSEDGQTGEKV